MLIGICGGICAGKHSVQDYLIKQHGFFPVTVQRTASTPSIEKSASELHVPEPDQDRSALSFSTVEDLLDWATKHWQEDYVTTAIYDEVTVEALSRRPFFILVHVDAPISVRWQRFKDRCARSSLTPPTLEQFVLRNDQHLYDQSSGLATLTSRAQIKLLNNTSSLSSFQVSLDGLNLTDPSRLRPTWDHYFMTLASLAARRSNCMRRQVGCVLVREKRVMSTGYNGTPRHITNCNEGGCPRCNSGGGGGAALATCLCIHAEENALLEAGRERVSPAGVPVGGGAVLYCNTCPCLTCSIKIVQVGIAEVVYNNSYYMDVEAAELFNQAGVKLRQFSPPKEGLVNLCDGEMTIPSMPDTASAAAVAKDEGQREPQDETEDERLEREIAELETAEREEEERERAFQEKRRQEKEQAARLQPEKEAKADENLRRQEREAEEREEARERERDAKKSSMPIGGRKIRWPVSQYRSLNGHV